MYLESRDCVDTESVMGERMMEEEGEEKRREKSKEDQLGQEWRGKEREGSVEVVQPELAVTNEGFEHVGINTENR